MYGAFLPGLITTSYILLTITNICSIMLRLLKYNKTARNDKCVTLETKLNLSFTIPSLSSFSYTYLRYTWMGKETS